MKHQYERRVAKYEYNPWKGIYEWETWGLGRYCLKNPCWFRHLRTQNERRQHEAAKADGYKVRAKRAKLPSSWDDRRIARDWGRSWKDYTKYRKQYYV